MQDQMQRFTEVSSATVTEMITSTERGRVAWQASHWFAEFYQPDGRFLAVPNQRVKVIGRRNITLLVIPA